MIEIREAKFTDVSQLRTLWKAVFGDGDEYLDIYFQRYFNPQQMLVTQEDDRIVSMSTVYRHEALQADGRKNGDCPCIFAVATDRGSRGKGLAMELIRHQIAAEAAAGTPYLMISPADKELAGLYESRFGFQNYFETVRLLCRPDPQMPQRRSDGTLQKIPAAVYNLRREHFLEGTNHLVFRDAQIQMEADTCTLSGGGLYALRCGSVQGICAAERISDTCVRVNELLIDEAAVCSAVLLLQAALPAAEYEFRLSPFADRLIVTESMKQYPGVSFHKAPSSAAMLLDLKRDRSASVLPGGRAYAGFVFD